MKTILKNCKLITPPFSEEKLYDIFIEGGLIADIGENLHVEDAKELDLDGHVVLPGFIDMHCNIWNQGSKISKIFPPFPAVPQEAVLHPLPVNLIQNQ